MWFSICCAYNYSIISIYSIMAECKEDTAESVKYKRYLQYQNLNKTFPQAKCSYEQFPQYMKEQYNAYRSFPIDLMGCPNRDKVFVVSPNCKTFKRLPKDTYPTKNEDLNKYNSCMLQGGNCDHILQEIDGNQLNYTINTNLDACNATGDGDCGIYDVNNIIYNENKLIKYVFYLVPIMSSICFFVIIILILTVGLIL